MLRAILNHKLISLSLWTLGLFAGPTCQAFTLIIGPQSQVNIGWQSDSVTFDIDASCSPYLSKVYDAIDTAANSWGAVPSSRLTINRGSIVSLPAAITTYIGSGATSYAPQGNPIVYCDTNFSSDSGQSANNIPGFAAAQNIDSDGKITGALLVLNVQSGATANINTLSSQSVAVILTHEIGHCLGFGHSADGQALMYYATNANRRVLLSNDDIDAVTFLYPAHDAGTNFLGCSSIAALDRHWGGGNGSSFLKTVAPDLGLFLMVLAALQVWAKISVRKRNYI